jgi:hypothetical protein
METLTDQKDWLSYDRITANIILSDSLNSPSWDEFFQMLFN